MGRPAPNHRTGDKTNLASLAAAAAILAFVLWVASFAAQPARLYAQVAASPNPGSAPALAGPTAAGDAS